jgi:hypothetical protein
MTAASETEAGVWFGLDAHLLQTALWVGLLGEWTRTPTVTTALKSELCSTSSSCVIGLFMRVCAH